MNHSSPAACPVCLLKSNLLHFYIFSFFWHFSFSDTTSNSYCDRRKLEVREISRTTFLTFDLSGESKKKKK